MTKNFKELDVWRKAHQFVLDVYRMTQQFPKSELYGLTSQFRRAAVSIPANLAEGYGRKGKKDKLRFYNIAEGSIQECGYYITLSRDLNYHSDGQIEDRLISIGKMLKGYIRKIEADL